MKLVMTLLVRNAADMIDWQLTYHRDQGVDFFIVTDNLSTDDTVARLQRYIDRGWVHLIHEPADTYEQGTWVTRMARLACTDFGADWVIHNDDDEFWWPAGSTLKETFRNLPESVNVLIAERTNFVYTPASILHTGLNARTRPFYEMVYHQTQSTNILGQPLPPKVAHRAHPAVVMPTGNHHVEQIGRQHALRDQVSIFHYPIRSQDQLLTKIETGCRAVINNIDKHPGSTLGTWKYLYEQADQEKSFKQLLKQQTYTPWRLWRESQRGTIARDTRLRDYLRKLRQPVSGQPQH